MFVMLRWLMKTIQYRIFKSRKKKEELRTKKNK